MVPDSPLVPFQVSRWQVAELVAAAVADPSIAENKILEVVAEETAPLRQAFLLTICLQQACIYCTAAPDLL